jgi:feruloyl esterase
VQLESVEAHVRAVEVQRRQGHLPGQGIGSEASWSGHRRHIDAADLRRAGSFQLAYQDPNWDWKKFDIDRDVKFVDEKTGFINAVDPDLSKFKARGGKS